MSLIWVSILRRKKKKEIPLQEPEIEPQLPFEPDWVQVLEIVPLYPLKQFPLIVCPVANVWSHSALLSFDLVEQ